MRTKKSNAALRPSPVLSVDEDVFSSRPLSTGPPSPVFNSAAFDRYMMGALAGPEENANDASLPVRGGGGGKEGGGGLGKKLLSFPWTRSDKKHAAQQQQQIVASAPSSAAAVPSSPTPTVSSLNPSPPHLQTTSSLPLGFPSPPPHGAVPSQHPSIAAFHPHPQHQHQHEPSHSSLSTFRTTSSFASTALFASSNDGWESEATSLSLTSSPESGRDSSSEGCPPRMWRVKGLRTAPFLSDIAESDDQRLSQCYDGLGLTATAASPTSSPHPLGRRASTPVRRNSTPVPRMVAMMLADPETPPRPKRYSTSSLQETSPSFDAAACETARKKEISGDDEDADDEVSPQRVVVPKRHSTMPPLGGGGLASARIPSIRFEGLSMDAVFAEVEKKLSAVEAEEQVEVAGAREKTAVGEGKKQRRRSRVLSLYKPQALSYGSEEDEKPRSLVEEPAQSTSSSSLASSTLSRTSSSTDLSLTGSTTSTSSPFDAPRPRPYPRRTSSRPSPLNVAAANAVGAWTSPASAPLQQGAPLWSPPAAGSSGFFSPTEAGPQPMYGLISPPLAGAFSPPSPSALTAIASSSCATPTVGASSLSPSTLGEPFNPTPTASPSPALSSASTFKPYDIPELLVCPPSPTQDELDLARAKETERRTRIQQIQRQTQQRRRSSIPPQTMVSGPTRVTVVPEKKMVRMSTRAPASSRRTYVSPSLLQASTFASPSSRSASPVVPTYSPLPSPSSSRPASPAVPVRRDSTPPVSPTIIVSPSFSAEPYVPSSVARTDFHPALSSLSSTVTSRLSRPSSPSSYTAPSDAGLGLAVSPAMGEDDYSSSCSSDCEESLHNMLMRLNRPHTPPKTPLSSSSSSSEAAAADEQDLVSTSSSLSLTSLALELHNTSHSRLSMLAREMGAVVASSSSSSPAGKENRAPSPSGHSSLLPSSSDALTSKRDRRLSKLYSSSPESTVSRFDDAPVLMSNGTARPLSPLVRHQSLAVHSQHGESGEGRNFSSSSDEGEGEDEGGEVEMPSPVEQEKQLFPHREHEEEEEEEEAGLEEDVDIESEIDKTLASICGTGPARARGKSHGSSFSISSAEEEVSEDEQAQEKEEPRRREPFAPKQAFQHTHSHQHQHTSSFDSFDSFDSSSSLSFDSPSPYVGERPKLPRSESTSSTFTDSSFDSTDEGAMDEVVVCLGERISCTYDVGVIGVAM
ncbi:hypothetical protein JCM8547_007713 [Rhodosporidiobolus lusitaniae]